MARSRPSASGATGGGPACSSTIAPARGSTVMAARMSPPVKGWTSPRAANSLVPPMTISVRVTVVTAYRARASGCHRSAPVAAQVPRSAITTVCIAATSVPKRELMIPLAMKS
jgi:hypothetical protein